MMLNHARDMADEMIRELDEHMRIFYSDYFAVLTRLMWRRRYTVEREHPEFVDLGGES